MLLGNDVREYSEAAKVDFKWPRCFFHISNYEKSFDLTVCTSKESPLVKPLVPELG
jgi:hypothetical protein